MRRCLLAVACLVALAGCGGDGSTLPAEAGPEPTPGPPVSVAGQWTLSDLLNPTEARFVGCRDALAGLEGRLVADVTIACEYRDVSVTQAGDLAELYAEEVVCGDTLATLTGTGRVTGNAVEFTASVSRFRLCPSCVVTTDTHTGFFEGTVLGDAVDLHLVGQRFSGADFGFCSVDPPGRYEATIVR